MKTMRWFVAAALMALTLAPATCMAQATDAKRPPSFSQAQKWMRMMSDYMDSLSSFKVHVEVSRELVFPRGGVITDDAYGDVLVVKPNKLRIDLVKPNRSRSVYYDGTTLSVYTPKQNVYGTIPVPPTIDEMIPYLRNEYGIDLTMADLLRTNIYGIVMPNVDTGIVVGPSVLNGVYCRHLAFRSGQKEWQIWIEYSNTPVPRRISIIDKSVKGSPRYTAKFSRWEFGPTFEPDTFTFTPPPGAMQIRFLKPSEVPGLTAPSAGE